MRLDVRAFALACGILWGLAVFLGTWWIIALEGASGDPMLLGRIYVGYRITPLGSIIGLVWGVVDGLIGGALFALLYNALTRTRAD